MEIRDLETRGPWAVASEHSANYSSLDMKYDNNYYFKIHVGEHDIREYIAWN